MNIENSPTAKVACSCCSKSLEPRVPWKVQICVCIGTHIHEEMTQRLVQFPDGRSQHVPHHARLISAPCVSPLDKNLRFELQYQMESLGNRKIPRSTRAALFTIMNLICFFQLLKHSVQYTFTSLSVNCQEFYVSRFCRSLQKRNARSLP